MVQRYGIDYLLDCLEENEKNGIVYHRVGIMGDYDNFTDIEELINFIKTGKKDIVTYDFGTINDIDQLIDLRIDYIIADHGSISENDIENVKKYFPDILNRKLGIEIEKFIIYHLRKKC